MRWALYVTVAPAWLDPGEVQGFITPFWIQYALHDALVKPMPGNIMTPSLAESWTLSPDQKTYEFKLRQGLKFHNGDPFTAEDVKFSFKRAKSSRILKEKVREVEIVDPYRVRFHLHEPFPDFMAFYGTLATASSWIVPKKYVEKVGDDGFKKQPVGLGPYKFVSNTPGHRDRHGGQRELLAQDALGEAPRLQERAGADHAGGDAEEGRSGHRLSAGRADRRWS